MSSLIRILRSASALWPIYLAIFLSAAVVAALGLVSPFLIREATDTIVGATESDMAFPWQEVGNTLIWLAVGLLLAASANSIMGNVGGYAGDVMASRLRQILSTRYYAKLLSLPQSYFDNQVTGTIIARLDRSITSVTQFLQSMANSFLPMMLQIIAILFITTAYYWPLTILLAALFPLYTWLTALTSSRWQRFEGEKNDQVDLANGRFSETVSQVKVVKSFVAENRELNLFGGRYGRTVELTHPQSRWWHVMDSIRGISMALIFFLIYLIIFYRTVIGAFSIGDMVMLLQLVTMAQQPVRMMSWMVDSAQRAVAGSKSYFAVMAQQPEPTANPQLVAATNASDVPQLIDEATPALPTSPSSPVIELENVTFSYEQDKPVLQNVSFTAAKGEKIALVGESGGGKSTIVNLLLGLYQVQEGSLRLCGTDVDDMTAAQTRANVGVVFQEPNLFSGTIRENISYGKPDATKEEIIAVAHRANAHAFIMAFPDGYDTVIGERGLRLSGGQQQRISVARAMLKDAPILVLDEATSSLDNRSEIRVQAGLDELMKNRTTLIIAHRLSTIADVDKIITLVDGHVDEIGSPAELATSGGIYSQLLQLTQSQSKADRERLKRFGFVADAGDDHEDD